MAKFTFTRSELKTLSDENIREAHEATTDVPNDHLLVTKEVSEAVCRKFTEHVADIRLKNPNLTYWEATTIARERHRELFRLSRARVVPVRDGADIVVGTK
ncbi:MAG: hypothetical protein JSR73_10695 [Proteobacteria bacterium]|nr:hypothetical protein [Pseudomonadota bacterium]